MALDTVPPDSGSDVGVAVSEKREVSWEQPVSTKRSGSRPGHLFLYMFFLEQPVKIEKK